jgi:hypothetical protein
VLLLGQVDLARLEQALETAVGLMLVLLGADVLAPRGARPDPLPRSPSRAGHHPCACAQPSRRGSARDSAHRHAHPQRWPLRALAVGMMHGLAGSAALVVLSLEAIPTIGLGVGYIALFGLGSIAGMACSRS